MFIRCYLELPFSADQVEAALLVSPPVGVGPLGDRLGRRVAVSLGAPVPSPR